VTNTTQPQQSQAQQMVQLTLTIVDRAQKNKRNLDTMTLLDSDDERGDKEDRYEHDEEGSLCAESTGDATEAASECADDDTTGNKTKKTTAAAVAKPRKKDQKPLDLNRLWDSRRVSCWKTIILPLRPLRYYWADPPPAGYILC
jgi:hypothetical protein